MECCDGPEDSWLRHLCRDHRPRLRHWQRLPALARPYVSKSLRRTALWNQVRSYADFYSHTAEQGLEAAANVAVVVDDLDTSDEAMNLLARHNIPFKVLRPADLRSGDLEGFDVVVVFAKPDRAACERL